MELRKIRTTHVETWVKSMTVATGAGGPLAPGTVKTRFVNVRSVFRAAVRDRLIAADPTDGVRLPRQRKRAKRDDDPLPRRGRAVSSTAPTNGSAHSSRSARFAGLRLGEAAALQFGDVDFPRQQLHVRRQVQRAGKKEVEIRLPKYGSERSVPMPDELAADPAPTTRSSATSRTGCSPAARTTRRTRTPSATSGGTPRGGPACPGIRLHDLRHFYASGLIAAGCDVVTVQRALGHAKASTTLDTYAKLWPSAEDRTRRAASTLAAASAPRFCGQRAGRETSEQLKTASDLR